MNVNAILDGLRGKRVLIVGDVVLDRWCYYDPGHALPSRETGLPRIAVVRFETTPGAGGTIANNLRALGVEHVSLLTAIGTDGNGHDLMEALHARQMDTSLVLRTAGRPTFTYTKLINLNSGAEDVPRVDFITTSALALPQDDELCDRFRAAAAGFDVILVSDQAETSQGGIVGMGLRAEINRFAADNPDRIVWVDSRARPELFRHVILKPNEDEAAAASERAFGEVDYRRLRALTEARLLIVTFGSKGAEVIDEDSSVFVQTVPVHDPVDICGAGDSFTAGASLALSVTGDPVVAAQFGNLVAAVTIMKPGTGTASPAEVQQAYERSRQ